MCTARVVPQGEYVAVEQVEATYKKATIVEQVREEGGGGGGRREGTVVQAGREGGGAGGWVGGWVEGFGRRSARCFDGSRRRLPGPAGIGKAEAAPHPTRWHLPRGAPAALCGCEPATRFCCSAPKP